jgi:N-acetylmuramoyl-L-alanine amidase
LQRPRPFVPIVSLAATLVLGPLLAGLAAAADPIIVRPGDTLTAISRRHGISVADIARLNHLPDPNRIVAGQRLRLEAETEAPAAPKPATVSTAVHRTHTVSSGEHLTGIARRYGVSIGAIVAANGIADPSRIYAGQRLVVPGSPAPARPASDRAAPEPKPVAAADRTHTVGPGEHLTGIARRYGVSIGAIVAANGIANPSRIYAGQRLVVRGAPAPSAAAPTASMPEELKGAMARRDDVRRIIIEEARRYDVPAPLALAVGWQESGWRQNVVSHAGAIGIMQLLPATGEWVGEAMLGQRVDLLNARDNVRAGVRLLKHYLARYDGNVDLVLAAYYQGQTAADRHGVYPVSRPYIASIRALARVLGG